MLNLQNSPIHPYLIAQGNTKEPVFIDPARMGRPVIPADKQVFFERTGEKEFTMHVLSGNPDEIAKCLNIVG